MIMQTFFALCFLFTLFLTISIVYIKIGNYMLSVIYAQIIWTLYLFSVTEFLSLFSLIRRRYLLLFWILYVCFLIVFAKKCMKVRERSIGDILTARIVWIRHCVSRYFPGNIMLLIIFSLLAINTYTAIHTVPYNWDSMTYHLSRIMYWIQNRSVSYFETNIPRQLISPVLAEYVNLHVICLTGGDLYVNMLQNFSEIICTISIIASLRKLKVRLIFCYLGGFLFCAANEIVAEGCSTQVDVYSAMWTLMAVYLILELVYTPTGLKLNRINQIRFAMLGIACGFLYLSKPSACIPVLIVAMWAIMIRIIRKDRSLHLSVLCCISMLAALLVASVIFIRNYKYCGDIFAHEYMSHISIGTFHMKYMIVNAFKNLATVLVWPGSESMILDCANKFANFLHVDINAPEISFGANKFLVQYSYGMDSAGFPVLAVILVITFLLFIVQWIRSLRKRQFTFNDSILNLFVLSGFLQLLLSLAFIRWQPWIARLLIPSFAVAVLPAVIIIDRTVNECPFVAVKRGLAVGLVFSVCLVNLSVVSKQCLYDLEPVIENVFGEQSRFSQYFRANGEAGQYLQMCDYMDSFSVSGIGLADNGAYQYPLLIRYIPKGIKVYPVDVNIHSVEGKSINEDFVPDIIVIVGLPMEFEKPYWHSGHIYQCGFKYDDGHSVWIRNKE